MKHALTDARPAAPKPADHFAFVAPVTVYEDLSKSDDNQQRRIAGVISTEAVDLQNERILQRGLNFDDFLGERGFFNNDHRKGFLDILGYPERVVRFAKGDTLPNGQVAKSATTWCEGYLLDTEAGRATYDLAKALVGTGRCLGFSVEGRVEMRKGGGKTIAMARIQHCAITHQPVNQDSRLEVLLRSLTASCEKGLALTTDGAPPSGPASSDTQGRNGSGMTLSREALSRKVVSTASTSGGGKKRRKRRKDARKSQARPCLLESLYSEFPDLRPETAVQVVKALNRTRPR